MKKSTTRTGAGLARMTVLAALLLAACGGGGLPLPERQFGVTEAQLMDAAHNPNGVVVGLGSGLVVSRLEPAGGLPAPLVGDTATVGVDELWFDVDYPGSVSVDLSAANLPIVSQVDVLDKNGVVLWTALSGQAKTSVQLKPGRYLLRLTGAEGATDVALAMIWFGGESKLENAADLAKLASGNCPDCNLRGARVGGINLRGANLPRADLREAIVAKVPGGFTLDGTDMMKLFLGGADVTPADLSGTNLAGALLSGAFLSGSGSSPAKLFSADLSSTMATDLYLPRADMHGANLMSANFSRSVLSHANLRGANLLDVIMVDVDLSEANLSGADVKGADFTRADLSGATWVDDRVCAVPSVGSCQ